MPHATREIDVRARLPSRQRCQLSHAGFGTGAGRWHSPARCRGALSAGEQILAAVAVEVADRQEVILGAHLPAALEIEHRIAGDPVDLAGGGAGEHGHAPRAADDQIGAAIAVEVADRYPPPPT